MSESRKPPTGAAVVVGVDGSAGSAEALRWALAEARLREIRLRVVYAVTFDYPTDAEEGSAGKRSMLGSLGPNAVINRAQETAEDLLERTVVEVADDAGGVEIERQLIPGAAAEVLVNAVGGDDLLVVGSRGHGGFTDLLLGSVSQQCVHHAPCPVVVVHSRAGDTAR
jgi:nucleotide-binding universal stress UspA family protein